jgi:hypothetical protein
MYNTVNSALADTEKRLKRLAAVRQRNDDSSSMSDTNVWKDINEEEEKLRVCFHYSLPFRFNSSCNTPVLIGSSPFS